MNNEYDPFDPANLRITTADVNAPMEKKLTKQLKLTEPTESTKSQKPKAPEFMLLKLPYNLTPVAKLRNAQLAVLMELYHVHYKRKINPVPLANKNLSTVGITRKRKMKALKDLQNAGLISFECNGKSSPIVTLLWIPIRKNSPFENASI